MTQVSVCQSQSKLHSVHPTLFLQEGGGGGEGVEPLTKFEKLQLLEGGCWELFPRGDFFNLKYLMTKKVYKQKYFSL